MNKNPFEKGSIAPDNTQENKSYRQYWESGGIINEKDYESVLTRARNTTTLDKTLIQQAENIAKFAGIELNNTEDGIDQRIILYGILRSDVKPEEVKSHHSQMSDQGLFVEALRMQGDTESLDKMIRAYPNISFIYHEEEKHEEKKAA